VLWYLLNLIELYDFNSLNIERFRFWVQFVFVISSGFWQKSSVKKAFPILFQKMLKNHLGYILKEFSTFRNLLGNQADYPVENS
jgi:hypothetical protein